MPNEEERFAVNTIITNLVEEIIKKRVLLKIVAWSNIDACCICDKNGDLPIHLLAGKLKKWASDIQTFIRYHVMDVSDLARISTISRTISEYIDFVLRPVALNATCHSMRGSVGAMSPLHISIMFTSEFYIFRLLLESTHAASLYYVLDNATSTDRLLPLEILERMKSDVTEK